MTIKRFLGLFFLIALISIFAIVYYPKTTEITSIEVNKDPISSNHNSNGDFKEFNESDVIVVIFPDHGSRYLSKIYSDKWMEDQGFSDSKREINNNDIQYIRK